MRRMYSENQLKKLISEYSGDIIKVSNVKNLTDKQCDSLECGDMVAKKTGKQYHLYLVTYKQAKHGLCLSYFDASVIETQSYDYTEGHWVYNSEDKTSFADIGGLPEVTAADNEKVLEVIAGAWGIGGKKVNVIEAPSSTTLTDELLEIFKEGTFINGEFSGFKNPIIFPAKADGNAYYGIIIGGYGVGKWYSIMTYNINVAKVFNIQPDTISLNIYSVKSFNGKDIPSYPAVQTDKTYTLKLVNGTLTWVLDA